MKKDRSAKIRSEKTTFFLFLVAVILLSALALVVRGNPPAETGTERQASAAENERHLFGRDLALARNRYLAALKSHSRYNSSTELSNIRIGKSFQHDTNLGICGDLRSRNTDGTYTRYVGFIGVETLQGQPMFIFEDDRALRKTWETVARNIGCLPR
jgi:hypothetical protein